MSWTTPLTAVAGDILTAAQYNVSVRDNLLATMTANASADGQHFVLETTNDKVGARQVVHITNSETSATTSTHYGNLPDYGPSVGCYTGKVAIVMISAGIKNSNNSTGSYVGINIHDAAQRVLVAPTDEKSIRQAGANANGQWRIGTTIVYTDLPIGMKWFTHKYRVDGGTGSFFNRRVTVVPF